MENGKQCSACGQPVRDQGAQRPQQQQLEREVQQGQERRQGTSPIRVEKGQTLADAINAAGRNRLKLDTAAAGGDHVQPSGARRSTKMPYFSAIPAMSLRRVALRATGAPRGETLTADRFDYEGGSDKYGYGNWAQGLEFEDTINHLMEHLLTWKASIERGEVDKDDHLAAIAWAVLMPLMTFERDYAEEFRERAKEINKGRYNIATDIFEPTAIDPDQIDAAMKKKGYYLIKPLSPVKR